MKSIIVYHSRLGKTQKVARTWAHRIGSSRLDVSPMGWRGTMEETFDYFVKTFTRQTMEIDLYKVDFEKYDRIVLMVPVIFGMMAAPMRSFIYQEAGNLDNVEYVLVHKGFLLGRKAIISWMDRHLYTKHVAASSIRIRGRKAHWITRIDGDSILR